ncbi:MAG: DUF1553 domain-containing protein, partial [Planctomycetales bacterium]|nr:DUF1553 domain-containing protein [Planctomycetales bacterium]
MNMRRRTCLFLLLLIFSTAVPFVQVQGQEDAPLHQRIDQAIETAHLGSLAEAANDYEFLRRIYLNLVGRGPTVDETKSFVANEDSAKRAAVIEQLLGSTEFDDFFTDVLDIMFMERRTGNRVGQSDWQSFLHKAVHEKWPFDRIVQTVLSADGTGELRGAAKFLLERDVEPNAVTRDVGRIFLGRDLQCAQCHDHPNIVDYEQSEYYGILAFVSRSYLFEQDTEQKDVKIAFVGEKAEGETEFSSVFSPDDSSHMNPQLLTGLTLEVEPRFDGEEAYIVAPSKTAAGQPKFSRRAQLARLITHPANEYFSKNVANRFWKHMMGHGLVDPVDFHHGENLPSHPALLKLLADEFVSTGFDFRELLRQIALSRTYQRSVDFPADVSVANSEVDRRMEALNTSIASLEAASDDQAIDKINRRLERRREKVAEVDQAITDAAKRLEELGQENTTLTKAHAELQQAQATAQSHLELVKSAATAAKKVADSFPEDQSLAEKHTDYQQRADQLTKELESTQAQLIEKKSLVDKTAGQIESVNLQLARLRAD